MDFFFETAIPLVMVIAGIIIVFIPPKILLLFDWRTGYWIYKQVLKSSGDEEKAIRAAGIFYKILGFSISAFALTFLL